MAINYRNFTFVDVSPQATTLTLNKPPNTQNNYFMIVIIVTNHSFSNPDNVITPPSGWNVISATDKVTSLDNVMQLWSYWALGSVSDLNFANSQNGIGWTQGAICVTFSGVYNASPIDAVGATNNNSASGSLTTNDLTIVRNGSLHLVVFTSWLGGRVSAPNFTTVQNPGVNTLASLSYNLTPKSNGAAGTVSVTNNATPTGQTHFAFPFSLIPAPDINTSIANRSVFFANNQILTY